MNHVLKKLNRNFNKGVTVYQMFLMAIMIVGAILNDQFLILFSMFNCLFGYLEPNQDRFSLGGKR